MTRPFSLPIFGKLLFTTTFAALGVIGCAQQGPKQFGTPEVAALFLTDALRGGNPTQLREVLGQEYDQIVSSGDEVADRAVIEKFLEKYDQKHRLVADKDGSLWLQVGTDDWPCPIPLVQDETTRRWYFDAEAGKEEIVNRRIGRNELDAMQVCMAIVDAQKEYVAADHDGDGVLEYARKFFSDPDKKNGLYWKSAPGEPPSPLGELVADAAGEGYTRSGNSTGPRPYHGYFYRILTAQGPAAPGGELDYLIGGNMIGGFAVIAWPAEYGNSGIMSFMTSAHGVVYERDLGPNTAVVARDMTRFDPAEPWKPADVPPPDHD